MGILSNFIGAAAGAGGEIMQRQREADVDLAKQKSYAEYASELDLKKQTALEILREERGVREADRGVTRQTARDKELRDANLAEEKRKQGPDYIAAQTAADLAKNQGILKNRVALAPETAAATDAEFKAGAGTREAAQKEKLSFALDEFRQKTAAELQADIARLNDPKYLAGKSKEAAAGRDPNSAALHKVQLEAANLALSEKKAEMKMPPAVRNQADVYKEQFKAINKAIYDATASGMTTPGGLNELRKEQAGVVKKIEDLYLPYIGDKAPKPVATDGLDKDLASRIAALSASKGGAKPGATKTDAPKAAQPSEPPRDQGARNPDIDASGRPLPRPSGDDSNAWQRTVKPGIVGAVDSVNQAGASAMKTYLSEKIARKEPLSPSEQVRAKQFGLLK